jgi:hypothetical protein
LFTLGGFVRRDGFNYYPSANPFSDLTGDLQSETFGQNRTLTTPGALLAGVSATGELSVTHRFLRRGNYLALLQGFYFVLG